jgi:uncharacterized membrane protein YoaK (UPF0700 family)
MLLILTWAAGCVDAISYLGLGHVFTAMMTGNTVLLGLALAQGEILAALRSIVALIGFAAGVAAGAMIVERDEDRRWPRAVTKALALEAVFLAVFSSIGSLEGNSPGPAAVYFLIALLSLAMGIQAAAVRRLGVPGIATTYITGTMTSLMVDLVGWMRSAGASARPSDGEGNQVDESSGIQWERRVGLLAGVFFVYGFGALAGGVLHAQSPLPAALSPLIAVGVVVMNAYVRYRR